MSDPELYFDLHVFCCVMKRPENHPRGCCAQHGAENLHKYMAAKAKELGLPPEKVRINRSWCLDRCELGPVMVVYPQGIWYRYKTEEDIDEILQSHLIEGGRAERLILKIEDGPKAA